MRRKRKQTEPVIYPVDRAERMAKILGESSAAAHALKELKKRLSDGEDVVLLVWRSMILVGPRP